MENFLGTLIFILPGFMLYFWIQMMGINPVTKHSPVEFGALAALAWLPVVLLSLLIMSIWHDPIDNIKSLQRATKEGWFLLEFIGVSVVASYALSIIYVKFGFPAQQAAINWVRKWNGKAELSKSPSVWEEVFLTRDPAVIGIGKIGADKPDIIGSVVKASRPFEAKRAFKLVYVDYVTKIVKKYEVPIMEVYADVDSGINVFVYDLEAYNAADDKEREEVE